MKARVEPAGVELEVARGQSVMEAARAAGYYWPTTCNMEGMCTTCAMTVLAGGENLSEMGRYERKNLVRQRGERSLQTAIRLACQARAEGDGLLVVERPGVRPA